MNGKPDRDKPGVLLGADEQRPYGKLCMLGKGLRRRMEGEKATQLTRELAPVPHALALQDIPLMTEFRKGAARLRPKLVHPSVAADWAVLVSARRELMM